MRAKKIAKQLEPVKKPTCDRMKFFLSVRSVYGAFSQEQVDGFNCLLDSFDEVQNLTPEQTAYLLATAWHETARTMQPIIEKGLKSYIEQRYDPIKGSTPGRRARAVQMGNTSQGDGWLYRGRGYVQLTWKNNYAKMGRLLNLDLVNDPDLALDPKVAGVILRTGMMEGHFTGISLIKYINHKTVDFVNARRTVNGTDRATEIAQYARIFLLALKS